MVESFGAGPVGQPSPDTSPPPSGCPAPTLVTLAVGAVVAVARRRQESAYNGALAKPIMLRPLPTFWGAVVPKRVAAHQKQRSRHERANAAELQRQRSRKLALLFDHYGIADKKDMSALAWALAVEHVPGFKVQFPEAKSKRGRKRKWHPDRLEELYLTVEVIKQQHHFTDRQALQFMVNNQRHAATWSVPTGREWGEATVD